MPIVALAKSGDERATREAVVAASRRSEDQLAIALFDREGHRILGELRIERPVTGWSDVTFYDSVEGSDPARVLATDLPNGERLAVAGNRRPLETADEALGRLWIFAAAVILLLSLSLAILLGRYLDRRLQPITRTSDAVIAGDLSHRVALSKRTDEFDRVAISLNAMLDRVSQLMENLRGIASDIAHDLRTPLGRLRAKLELASADPLALGTREEVIETTIAAIDEILTLFGAVLRIAEIEEGGATSHVEAVRLDLLAEDILEAMWPVFDEAGFVLRQDLAADAVVVGDREQLAAAIINLLENALRHSSLGAVVTLCVARSDAQVELKISDTGPGVPEKHLDRIFDRFVRLDPARATPGHGLGLSLVRAIVLANRGTVAASNRAPGFAITIRFPSQLAEYRAAKVGGRP